MNSNLNLYRSFVRNRHSVYEQRLAGIPQPWTDDPIVATRKFTNVFRILDRGSQFLYEIIRDTDYHTALFRAFLYRYTNRPEPWVAFEESWGWMPGPEDAVDGTLLATWRSFRNLSPDLEVNHRKVGEMAIFGNAYKMFSGQENKGTDRLTWAVNLARDWMTPEFAAAFETADSQQTRNVMLQEIPRCKGFMSMQILTDMSYYAGYDENEFVIAGPGAVRGSSEIDKRAVPLEMIRELTSYWAREGDVNLYGRTPSLMDVQNTLCEFSKYVKWKPGPTQYKPVGPQQFPILPPHYEGLI